MSPTFLKYLIFFSLLELLLTQSTDIDFDKREKIIDTYENSVAYPTGNPNFKCNSKIIINLPNYQYFLISGIKYTTSTNRYSHSFKIKYFPVDKGSYIQTNSMLDETVTKINPNGPNGSVVTSDGANIIFFSINSNYIEKYTKNIFTIKELGEQTYFKPNDYTLLKYYFLDGKFNTDSNSIFDVYYQKSSLQDVNFVVILNSTLNTTTSCTTRATINVIPNGTNTIPTLNPQYLNLCTKINNNFLLLNKYFLYFDSVVISNTRVSYTLKFYILITTFETTPSIIIKNAYPIPFTLVEDKNVYATEVSIIQNTIYILYSFLDTDTKNKIIIRTIDISNDNIIPSNTLGTVNTDLLNTPESNPVTSIRFYHPWIIYIVKEPSKICTAYINENNIISNIRCQKLQSEIILQDIFIINNIKVDSEIYILYYNTNITKRETVFSKLVSISQGTDCLFATEEFEGKFYCVFTCWGKRKLNPETRKCEDCPSGSICSQNFPAGKFCPNTKNSRDSNTCYNLSADYYTYSHEFPNKKNSSNLNFCINNSDNKDIKKRNYHNVLTRTCRDCNDDKQEVDTLRNICICKNKMIDNGKFDSEGSKRNELNRICVDSCNNNQKEVIIEEVATCVNCSTDQFAFGKYGCFTACPIGTLTVEEKVDNVDYQYCKACEEGKVKSGEICEDKCPTGQSIKTSNEGAKYCGLCSSGEVFEGNDCKLSCNEGRVPSRSKICGPCPDKKYFLKGECIESCLPYYFTNSTAYTCDKCPNDKFAQNGVCVEKNKCSISSIYLESPENYCHDCKNDNQYMENNTCLETCKVAGNVPDTTKFICSPCSNYLYDSKCYDTCPEGTMTDEKQKICIKCNYFKENSICVDNCSENYAPDKNMICNCDTKVYRLTQDKKCVKYCPYGTLLDSTNTTCIKIEEDSSASSANSTNSTLVNECKTNNKTYYNNECVDYCKSPLYYSVANMTCVDSCLVSDIIKIQANQTVCEPCKANLNEKGECIESCPFFTGPNKDKVCKPCDETYNNHILDRTCVNTCDTSIYDIKKINGRKNVCVLKAIESKNCTNFICQNQGNCTMINYRPLCTCSPSYYGLNCQTPKEKLNEMTSLLDKKIDELIKTDSDSLDSEKIRLIMNLSQDVIKTPEAVTPKLDSLLTKISIGQLDLVKNRNITMSKEVLQIIDQSLEIKNSIKSNISNITAYLSRELSSIVTQKRKLEDSSSDSIYYSGSAFSVQVTTNYYNDLILNNARKAGLGIVEFSKCETILKKNGILKASDVLHSVNLNLKNPAPLPVRKADSSNSTSNSSRTLNNSEVIPTDLSIVPTFTNQHGVIVDSSLCNVNIMMPLNNMLPNLDEHSRLQGSYNVDIYNASEPFFTDLCFIFTNENDTYYTLNERRNFYNKTAVCSKNCAYGGVDEHGYLNCTCNQTTAGASSTIENTLFDALTSSNIYLLGCMENITKQSILENPGFIALIVITSLLIGIMTIQVFILNPFILSLNAKAIIYNDFSGNIFSNTPAGVGEGSDKKDKKEKKYQKIASESPSRPIDNANNEVLDLNINTIKTSHKKPSGKISQHSGAGLKINNLVEGKGSNKTYGTQFEPTDDKIQPSLLIPIEIKQKEIILREDHFVNRGFCDAYCYELKHGHDVFNIVFYFSIINPHFIRISKLFISISIQFGVSALFYSSSYIEQENKYKTEKDKSGLNFIYVITDQFGRVFWPAFITILFKFIAKKIVAPPSSLSLLLNNYLVDDPKKLKQGKDLVTEKMMWRYVLYFIFNIGLHILCWIIVMCFCSTFVYQSKTWIYGSILGLLVDYFIFGFIYPLIISLIREVAVRTQSNAFKALYILLAINGKKIELEIEGRKKDIEEKKKKKAEADAKAKEEKAKQAIK